MCSAESEYLERADNGGALDPKRRDAALAAAVQNPVFPLVVKSLKEKFLQWMADLAREMRFTS